MSSTKKEIVIPESVFQECFHLYTDVLTYSTQKSLEKLFPMPTLQEQNISKKPKKNNYSTPHVRLFLEMEDAKR